jgi:hypothetical protein
VLEHEQAVADVPLRRLAGRVLAGGLGRDSPLPVHAAGGGQALFPGVSAQVQPLGVGALHDGYASGDAIPRVGGLLQRAGLRALGAGLRQYEDGHRGRDDQEQPIWHRSLLQLAAEFDFHPVACWPDSGNQKGSVESLVKFTKTNFLVGRTFVDDADLEVQCLQWQTRVTSERVSQATDVTPLARLVEESAKGGTLPVTAVDYGFAEPGKVSRGALVPMLGNNYSVPVEHVGAPVTVRVHRQRIVIWRDAERLAEHRRAPDGAHRRVIEPAHFAPVFARKPRARVMLYREVLLELGEIARSYLSELSHRQRSRLGDEVREVYALYERCGAAPTSCWRRWSWRMPKAPTARHTCARW